MEVRNLSDGVHFFDVSFQLHSGEVLGIVGLEGCGKNEIVRSIFGKNHYTEGSVVLMGQNVDNTIGSAIKHRIAFVPAERKVEGLFLKQSIAWNTTIASLPEISRFKTISRKTETDQTIRFMRKLNTKAEGPDQNIALLSGGNQQKVMLSRWIMTGANVFLLEEPTRGIDINAKTDVYHAIGDCIADHKGVIVVSSEEEEVLGICDRIIVMKNGQITKILSAKDTTLEEIKQYSV